jgi:hypothetical protein
MRIFMPALLIAGSAHVYVLRNHQADELCVLQG